eukprot:COSAG03_NODE_3923_length_1758_cov_7.858951_1_plen_46_part_10
MQRLRLDDDAVHIELIVCEAFMVEARFPVPSPAQEQEVGGGSSGAA